MTTTRSLAVAIATTFLFVAPSAIADPLLQPHKDPVCTKYQKYDKFGNREGNALGQFKELCRDKCSKGFTQCDLTVEVLRGKTDPKQYHPFFKDAFHTLTPERQNRARCIGNKCNNKDVYTAAVIYGTPGVKDMLLAQITPDRLGKLNCGDKQLMYQALFYLGDKTAADKMIEGYNNLLCTNQHFNFTVPNIHLWGLSDTQHAAIEKVCVEQVYAEKARNAKSSFDACHIYFAQRGKIGEDGMEYLKGKSSNELADRALAFIDTKGRKGKLVKELSGAESEEVIRKNGKYTKKKRKMWRGGILKQVVAGYALSSIGDKNGKKAVAYWLSIGDKKLANSDGWDKLFTKVAPYLPEAQQAKFRKVLIKAFGKASKALKGVDNQSVHLLRASYGLARMGSNAGFANIMAALNSDDASTRREAAEAVGGSTNMMSRGRNGSGMLKFGKGNLSKADGEKLLKMLAKRAKFQKDKARIPFILAHAAINGLLRTATF